MRLHPFPFTHHSLPRMSESTMTQDEALKWLADVFGISPANLNPDTPRTDISNWDSMGVLALMSSLDETFGIVVDDADMRAMKKVGDVIALLQARGKIKS